MLVLFSKRRHPDVEAVAAQLSNLPMVSNNMDVEGQEVVKKVCLEGGRDHKVQVLFID